MDYVSLFFPLFSCGGICEDDEAGGKGFLLTLEELTLLNTEANSKALEVQGGVRRGGEGKVGGKIGGRFLQIWTGGLESSDRGMPKFLCEGAGVF